MFSFYLFQQCNASICKLIGWKECQSFSDAKKLTHDEREELCYIGCRKYSKENRNIYVVVLQN